MDLLWIYQATIRELAKRLGVGSQEGVLAKPPVRSKMGHALPIALDGGAYALAFRPSFVIRGAHGVPALPMK
jgi:hypothetical protein